MAEIIDFLLIFWGSLGAVVFVFGHIYEHQQKELIRKQQRKQRGPDTTNLDDLWRQQPTASSSYYSSQQQQPYSNYSTATSQQQYNNSQHYGSTNQQHFGGQQQQQPQRQSIYLNNDQFNNAYSQYAPTQLPRMASYNDTFQQDLLSTNNFNYNSNNNEHQFDNNNNYKQQYNSTLQQANNTIPTATGFNSDCVEWVNNILFLFFTQTQKYGPIISESIYRSLNEKLSNIFNSSSEYSHLIIEFTGINQEFNSMPELTNIRTEIECDKSVSVCCKIYNQRISFNLNIQQLYTSTSAAAAVTTSNELESDFFGHQNNNRLAQQQQQQQYELVLENLEGKIKSVAMLSEKLIVIQFMEKPDTKILLRPIRNATGAVASSAQQQVISEDALVQIILQALTQVVVDLYFGDDVDFPQFTGHLSKSGTLKNKLSNMLKIGSATGNDLKRQIKQEFFNVIGSGGGGGGGDNALAENRRIFIKILRANNINYNQNVTCLIELDNPQQQALSTTKLGNSNPNWDEHFLFYLTEKTSELTVELWDSLNSQAAELQTATKLHSLKRNQSSKQRYKSELTANAKFLGLARLQVALDELRRNPVQKVTVSLQPEIGHLPGDLSQSVGGELAIELLYLENQQNSGHSPTPSIVTNTGSGLKKSTSASSLGVLSSTSAYCPGDVVSIDRKLTPSGYVITTTTITKQPQTAKHTKQRQSPRTKSIEQTNFDDIASSHGVGVSPGVSRADTPAGMSIGTDARSEGAATESVATRSTGGGGGGGGRLSRSRSRSLLRAIKKRFSFSRSRSLGPSGTEGDGGDYQADADSACGLRTGSSSVTPAQSGHKLNAAIATTTKTIKDHPGLYDQQQDYYGSRSRASSEISNQFNSDQLDGSSRAKSVPTSRDLNEVPTIVINKSRLSDTASAFTFTHPKSQLVIEVLEPSLERENGGRGKQKGKYRYYAIADNSTDKRKWSRRGIKLHLFNEHQFVACHLAGSSTCHLCGRVFSRRPGKQGYKCRNCHLLSHKQCHVKVDHNCPYAASNGLQLEYIDAEPPSNLINELVKSSATTTATQAAAAAKSRQRTVSECEINSPTTTTSGGRGGGGALTRQQNSKRALRQTMSKSISVEVDDR